MQELSLKWMMSNWNNNVNCILGDEVCQANPCAVVWQTVLHLCVSLLPGCFRFQGLQLRLVV